MTNCEKFKMISSIKDTLENFSKWVSILKCHVILSAAICSYKFPKENYGKVI